MSTGDPYERHMRRAIEIAGRNPGAPFAALLVHEPTGRIVAEGINGADKNPTWHGEIVAINRYAATGPDVDWPELMLVTTAEPCPMCQGAILWAGIAKVAYGTSIRRLQQLGWSQIDILAEEVVRRTPFGRCELIGGVLRSECDALFEAAVGTR